MNRQSKGFNMPKQIYLNKTEIAKLLVSQSDVVLQQLKPWFDEKLKKNAPIKMAQRNGNDPEFYAYMGAKGLMEKAYALKRIIKDFDAATQDPDGTLAKRFLRDLYQVVYYMYGDEKSGLKPQDIQDDKTFNRLTDFRVKYFGDFNQRLKYALDSKTIELSDFAKLARDYADKVQHNEGAVQDDKLKDLIEKKLFDVANATIKKVDLSPKNMDHQKSNFEAISHYVKWVLDGLYPVNNDHKSEIVKNWSPEAIAKRALEVQGIKKPARKAQTPQDDDVYVIGQPSIPETKASDLTGEKVLVDKDDKANKLKQGKKSVWSKIFARFTKGNNIDK